MTFQNTVNFEQGIGLVGSLVDDGPYRAATMQLTAASGQQNKIGTVYTIGTDDFSVVQGGSGTFSGILINPLEQALHSGLDANLNLPDGSYGPVCSFGRIYVTVPEAVTPGMIASYETATGKLHANAASTTTPVSGQLLLINAVFKDISAAANGVSILELGAVVSADAGE